MADIITAIWLSALLYNEMRAATNGTEPIPLVSGLLSTSLFTALEFIIGNVGSNLGSDVAFVRLLWPERYYNSTSFWDLTLMGLTMSAAAPLQAASKRAMDDFLRNGLFKGAKEGDMLGTAFFEDSKSKYKAFVRKEDKLGELISEEARNNFWATVIELLPRKKSMGSGKDEEKAQTSAGQFANRRVFHLTLGYESAASPNHTADLVKKHKTRSTLPTMLLGIIFSEATAVSTGCTVAVVWHSFFALIWFLPLILKLLAIRFRVRRTPLVSLDTSTSGSNGESSAEPCVFEIDDSKHGLIIIQAPVALGTQFFRHFGYPQRSNLPIDRWNERISIGLVVAAGAYFPIAWVAFAFASNAVRWMWVCYQLYTLIAMVVLTYWNLSRVGSLEANVAKTLQAGHTVHLVNEGDGAITVQLESMQTSRIAEARKIVESKKLAILGVAKPRA